MTYAREPLLTQQQEDELKLKMEPLWNQTPRLTGMEIAKKLKFGIPETIYAKLKPNYVYFYRMKFNLPLHGKARFKKESDILSHFRYKKTPEELKLMSENTFIKTLNKVLPRNEFNQAQRCFLLILYHTPLRASEIYEREVKDDTHDFEILSNKIIIHLLRKKKHFHKKPDESISVRRDFALVEELVEYLESRSWETTINGKPNKIRKKDIYGFPILSHGAYLRTLNHRPFPISKSTSDVWVKDVFGKDYYCHYWRFRYCTSATQVSGMKVSELIAKTHLTLGALEHYIFTPEMAEDEFDAKKALELKRSEVK